MKKNVYFTKYVYPLVIVLLIGLCCGCGGDAGRETLSEAVTVSENADSNGSAIGDGELAQNASGVDDVVGDGDITEENDASGAADHGGTVSGNSAQSVSVNDAQEEGAARVIRPEPVKVKGIYVSGPVAGIAKMDDLIDLVDQTELNAMVIDVKNDEGKVTYRMQSDQVLEIDAGVRYISDIEELVGKCKEKDIYLIARIVAFRDPYLAEQKPEWAVHTKDGAIFRDKSGLAWVNPYEREVWDYLVEIAAQAAKDGFDEVQFDYIRFSTDIKEGEVDYGPESENVDKIQIITEFTEYLYEKLAPRGVYVAADVFGTVIDNETDQAIVGQDYVQMAAHLDYICPMVYPSHYHNGSYGIKVPDAEPYRTIHEAATSSVQELCAVPEEKRAGVRMWLQSFTAGWVPGHISYGPEQIRAQIKGAYDAGYDEWILWNAAVNYQSQAFLTDEEAEAERQRWDAEAQNAEATEAVETEAQNAEAAEAVETEAQNAEVTEVVETETENPVVIEDKQ